LHQPALYGVGVLATSFEGEVPRLLTAFEAPRRFRLTYPLPEVRVRIREIKEDTMPEQVIYLDHFSLHDGKLESFKRYAADMASFVEMNEPEVTSFNYYMDEDGESGTAVFVFSDGAALDRHLEVASSRFQEGYELVSGTNIELLGPASDQAVALARSFGGTAKAGVAGFTR
jgi:hypothetical protein